MDSHTIPEPIPPYPHVGSKIEPVIQDSSLSRAPRAGGRGPMCHIYHDTAAASLERHPASGKPSLSRQAQVYSPPVTESGFVERIVPIQLGKISASSQTNCSHTQKQVRPSNGERTGSPTPPQKNPVTQPATDPHHKLKRGISNTVENVSLVSKVRSEVLQNIEEAGHGHMYTQTFVMPDLTVYSEDFHAFLEKDLIETSTLVSLEQSGRLNWWTNAGVCRKLMPMATSGDGNCLLHAASLAMWGVHDRDLILRRALYDSMTKESYCKELYRRWRWQQTQINKESGLIFSEDEWVAEWNNLLKLASLKPRSYASSTQGLKTTLCPSPVVYESLEEFHVFVLAHVLQRPIIVVADTVLRDANGDALAPIPFGGIYLPLECPSETCYHVPLMFTYDAAHFSALVPMEQDMSPDEKPGLPAAIPLVDPNFDLLPIHFPFDPKENVNWKLIEKCAQPLRPTVDERLCLLQKYLEIDQFLVTRTDLDNDSETDRKSCGSCDSDESTGKEKKRDSRVSQQMQTVAKQFGSIGKSMGKKLKKNFVSIGKSGKPVPPEIGEKIPFRPASVLDGVVQSTKLTLGISVLLEKEKVLCAKLLTSRTEVQSELIKNYLSNVEKRFEKDRELKKKKGEDIAPKCGTVQVRHSGVSMKCVTAGCNMYGTAQSCYLCSKCFSQQKQQALNQEKSKDQCIRYNTYPCHVQCSDSQVHLCGKSKFYTSVGSPQKDVADGESPQPLGKQRPASLEVLTNTLLSSGEYTQTVNENGMPTTANNQVCRRAPSPHYDNVDYSDFQKNDFNTLTGSAKRVKPVQCQNKGCEFYGSAARNFLCSKCFKDNQKTSVSQAKSHTQM